MISLAMFCNDSAMSIFMALYFFTVCHMFDCQLLNVVFTTYVSFELSGSCGYLASFLVKTISRKMMNNVTVHSLQSCLFSETPLVVRWGTPYAFYLG